MRLGLVLFVGSFLFCLSPAFAGNAQTAVAEVANGLAAHRANYRLTFESSRGGDIIGGSGTMSFEVMDACEGWAVEQKLSMIVTNRDGEDVQMETDYVTWESKNGTRLRFRMHQTTDQANPEVTSGEAVLERVGGKGEVHYSQPKNQLVKLPPGTLFPMWHTATIIAGAEAGKKFLSLPLFDGTAESGAQDTFVIVTDWQKPSAYRFPSLSKLPSGRVHISFFNRTPNAFEPDYEVGMRYWQNGVADDIRMDFGEFVMLAHMTDFKLQPPHRC
jgi:hypothetical protein